MNKPRGLIRIAVVRPFRSNQPLTRLRQLVPGAVLLSTLPLTQERACRARPRDYCGFLVKNVRFSLCNLVCTKVFTLSPPMVLRERNIQSRSFKSSGRKTTKTGGSDPPFSAFRQPQSVVGSLPPVCSDKPSHTKDINHQQDYA
jgi:hypothetical protein